MLQQSIIGHHNHIINCLESHTFSTIYQLVIEMGFRFHPNCRHSATCLSGTGTDDAGEYQQFLTMDINGVFPQDPSVSSLDPIRIHTAFQNELCIGVYIQNHKDDTKGLSEYSIVMYSFSINNTSFTSQLVDDFSSKLGHNQWLSDVTSLNPCFIAIAVIALLTVHRFTRSDLLSNIPGPWLAKYTSLLLGYYTRTGKRYLHIDRLHKIYGPFVRIAPNHVSCADPSAPSTIYAQGSLSLPKSSFYKSFYVGNTPSLFSTQDRNGHAQKRRVLAHPFSQASVKQFEGWIRKSLRKMIQGLDGLCISDGDNQPTIEHNRSGLSVGAETVGRAGGSVQSCEPHHFLDLLMWLNYMTFDVISDLAFGEPLGMLDRASDVLGPSGEEQVGVAAMIDYRGRTAAYLGLFPYLLPGSWLAPFVKFIPDAFIKRGLAGTDTLSHIARRCIRKRLDAGAEGRRGDLLDRLMDTAARENAEGEEVSEADIITEAMLLLTAGSDTTVNSTAAIMYWIARSPQVLQRLRHELDEAVRQSDDSILPMDDECEDVDDEQEKAILWYDNIKNVKYLQATIDEGLRMFATNAFGLPRVVPEGMNVRIKERMFGPGTELSTPAYTIQHDLAIWGDPEVFRPERWLDGEARRKEGGLGELKKHLLTFGMGPRACIGKNLAYFQMQILVATLVQRYDITLRDGELRSVEGFMHKPVECWVKIRKRAKTA